MLCPHGCGHAVPRGQMHKKENCPPSRGKHGDRGHSLYPGKIGGRYEAGDMVGEARGVAVKHTSGSKAKTHRRGRAKTEVSNLTK